jgi:hypothetical protein
MSMGVSVVRMLVCEMRFCDDDALWLRRATVLFWILHLLGELLFVASRSCSS